MVASEGCHPPHYKWTQEPIIAQVLLGADQLNVLPEGKIPWEEVGWQPQGDGAPLNHFYAEKEGF